MCRRIDRRKAVHQAVRRLCLTLALVIVSAAVYACDGGRQDQKNNTMLHDGTQSSGGQAGNMVIALYPAQPLSGDDIQVMQAPAGASFQWRVNGRVVESETGPVLQKGHFSREDTVSVSVSTGPREATVSTVIKNSPPVISAVNITPAVIHRSTDITVVPEAADADGDHIRFQYVWSINEGEVSDSENVLRGAQLRRGDRVSLTIVPSDFESTGRPFTIETLTVQNASPRFVTSPSLEFTGTEYRYQAKAEDPDGDRVQYSLAVAPQGMTIDPGSGLVAWTSLRAGVHRVEIVAQDPGGGRSVQSYSFTITIPKGAEQ